MQPLLNEVRGLGDREPVASRCQMDAHADLLSMACDDGRCIPDGVGHGLDVCDDDLLFELTEHRRKPAITT